ncbi:MAG: beta-ketoacyl-[acyl-carrier-protein] synthase family protein [Xanthomonadales bacterium PRO7]|jgi:nodulation protein E|nr:beta-ketoacyl-[acyl-carrier-protein] synthase family protein [Xanthomonadales bacterium PRO7]HMM57147.1 beta-ketoacyl-[acyl-carrier-protein] synthase family protein [Rudaea sp.]
MRRVAITGMGAITALGHDAASTWAAMREGRSGIGPIANIPTDLLNVKIAAEVRGFDPATHIDTKKLPLLDRVSQFALVAAREAVAQSGLDFRVDNRGERSACIIGSGIGGEGSHNEQSRRFYAENNPRLHPLTILRVMANAPACHVGIEFGLRGPSFAVVSACASANHAMAQAADMIKNGKMDFAVTGGSEACVTVTTMKAWEAMRVTADDTCRPFCKQRRGMVLGEGAGIFVLEEWEHAKARGANILAEFAGSGMTADAVDMVFPAQATVARAMELALADAKLKPEDVDYINAHGTGTPANDPTETKAIRRAFGAHADKLAVSSTKSMHGHALGAAGAIELVAAIGSMRDGVVPPTANFIDADPECDLDYVPNTARKKSVRAALSNSFAFGGLNCVIALRAA